MYTPSNHYWIVAASTTQVYSSAAAAYVNIDDATYESWLAAGGTPTKITANDMLFMQIGFLEDTQTPRRMREGGTWLAALNAQIIALRAQLA